ncbi:hypothetical protein ABT294_25270, partial [Nonomuraea sp. NPDC000554]|uniref:hypothetical protein n=1 Tax=Nonomuraea sp. NPDC000554 TaxID=3154259 RepID=UPI0033278989
AALFERAAAAATTRGLAAARDTLLAGRAELPGGQISRDRLAQAARGRSAFAQPPLGASVDRDEGDIVTLLHVPGNLAAPMHFGPGVASEPQQQPPGTTAERIWREGRDQARTLQRSERASKTARARRRRTISATMVFAIIAAGAVVAWIKLGDAPELAITSVDVAAPKKTQGCDSAVVITGTIVTNGAAGEISYEWRKSLDKEVVKRTLRTTSDQTSYVVPLRWELKGKSTVRATATLRVLSPGPLRTEKASFTYKC